MSHPELKAEQAYVDSAYAYLERMRETVVRAGDAADGEVAQAALDAWAAKRLATFEDAERGLLFGRIDFEAVARALYVGRRWVHDEEGDQVVVNWQAPAARPFYTATPQDPHGVTLRRRFRAQGRKLLDIADEALDGSSLDGASVADFLLEELERSRDTHMRDIVATIQADRYRLITREPDRPLVIQGGPGTGKTAVEELRHAYRVPREIMELALPLLETIAPGTQRPLAYRAGGSAPVLRHVEEHELLREAYVEAARLAREDGLVALIVPDELVEPALAHESAFDGIPLLTPRDAKGLEFDHVIVVEPALVAAREQGLRELYVALTRPTTTLVVHARPLPPELGLP